MLRYPLQDASGTATVLHNMGLTADPASDPMQVWAHMGTFALDMQDVTEARYQALVLALSG